MNDHSCSAVGSKRFEFEQIVDVNSADALERSALMRGIGQGGRRMSCHSTPRRRRLTDLEAIMLCVDFAGNNAMVMGDRAVRQPASDTIGIDAAA